MPSQPGQHGLQAGLLAKRKTVWAVWRTLNIWRRNSAQRVLRSSKKRLVPILALSQWANFNLKDKQVSIWISLAFRYDEGRVLGRIKRKPRAEVLTSMPSRVDWKSTWEGTNQGDVIGVGGGFEEEGKQRKITVIGTFSTPYKAL
jgi:hypothetical protein